MDPTQSTWRCRDRKPGSRAGSCCCIFAMRRKLHATSLEHRPLVVVITCARCKRCPGLRMAGFRKFQQTSFITHKVFIAVEVCTPAMPFHTRLGVARPRVPKRSATLVILRVGQLQDISGRDLFSGQAGCGL